MFSESSLARTLGEHDTVLFAVLFGSRAGGRPRPDSDIDVGVFLSSDLSPSQRFEIRLRLGAALEGNGRADVVVLNDAPPLLAHRALLGKLVFVRDRTAYVRFVVRTVGESEDERYFRGIHRAARLRRLKEGRFGRP